MNKSFKLINNFIRITTFVFIFLILSLSSVSADALSGTNYTITFKCATGADDCSEGEGLPKECVTDKNGYIDNSCLSFICKKCNRWSKIKYNGHDNQTDAVFASTFASTVFENNITYYCVSGTSNSSGCSISNACYVCNDNTNIMKWGTNGSSDSKCSSGYSKDLSITESKCETIPEACYECKNNTDIVKWSTNSKEDNNCSSGYNKTTKSKAECVSSACYECKDNDNVFKWSTNGKEDNNCSSGYNKTTKSKAECVSSACYECKDNDNVFKWSINGDKDNSCSSGYNKTTKSKAECVPEEPKENVETGDILIILVSIIGLGALVFSIYYFLIRKKKYKFK